MIIMKTRNSIGLNVLLLFVLFTFLAGCKKEESLSLNVTETTLNSNQTFNLVVSPDASGCVFTSEDENVAEVSSTGVITPHIVGVTNIVVSNTEKGFSAKCKVTVTPVYSMYREPYLVFGKSKSDIKAYETRQISSETETAIIYTGENSKITAVAYAFETSKYNGCVCGIPSSQASLLGDFLAERYIYVGTTDDDIIAMRSLDGKILIGVEVYSLSTIMVYYFPNDSKNGLNSNSCSELKEMFHTIIK